MLMDFLETSRLVAQDVGLHPFPVFQSSVIFIGYFVLGITGFGSALIIIPLLAWQWPLTLIVPLVLMTDIPTSLFHTGLNFRQVAWRELPRLLPSVMAGAIAGIVLINVTSGHWLLGVLGLYVTWIGLRGFRRSEVMIQATGAVHQNAAGFLMGMVETMFGTAGPIVMMWLTRRLPNPHELRATMPTTIVLLSSMAIASAAMAGNLNQAGLWRWVAVLMPFAFFGVWCGHQVATRVNPKALTPIIYSLLTVSGVVLTVRAVMLLSA